MIKGNATWMAGVLSVAMACGHAGSCGPRRLFAQEEAKAAPGASSGRVCVVDPSHPKAADANPGTESQPWKTIAQAARSVKPGDTVYVMEGKYDERVVLTASGAAGQPIAFVSIPKHGAVMKGFNTGEASHLRIQGFQVTSETSQVGSDKYEGGIAVGKGERIEVLDNYVHGLNCGIGTGGKHIRIAYNRIEKCLKGILIGGVDCLFENNEVSRLYKHIDGDCDYSRGWGTNHVMRCNRFGGTRRGGPGEENEVGKSHVDVFQSWASKPGHLLQDFVFERNYCEVFSQGTMLESDKQPGSIARLAFRNNIYRWGGGWGLNMHGVQDATVEGNTFVEAGNTVIGFRSGTTGSSRSNICINKKGSIAAYDSAGKKIEVTDPKFADREKGNFRLLKESPLVNARPNGEDIGALAYPNVYSVDPRHPGASDDGFGYPGWPYATVAKALAVAKDGETILLRGGVYREAVAPKPGVTIRVMEGEKAVISGADVIEGWKREEGGFSAPLAAKPVRIVKEGQPFTAFSYDEATKKIAVAGFDPRIHPLENVVRKAGAKAEGLETVNALE